MRVRPMTEQDADEVSALCIDVFLKSVAPYLAETGVENFCKVAAPENLISRLTGGNVILLMEDSRRITGVVELREGRHVAIFFVASDCQRRGVGRRLMSALSEYMRADVITVNASLNSVAAYEHYGFACSGEVAESDGLIYQPMQAKRERLMSLT